MKRLYLSFLLLVLSYLGANAQAPAIQWSKSLGGSQGDQPYSTLKKLTADGGSIHVGSSQSNDGDVSGHHGTLISSDVWVVKLDSMGSIDWQQSYGGSAQDYGTDIILTADGGYMVCGQSASTDGDVSGNHGGVDIWLLKLSVSGAIQWQKSIGGPGLDFGTCIEQTGDGGYVVLACSDSAGGDIVGHHGSRDLVLFKIDAGGTMTWLKCYGGSKWEQSADNSLLLSSNGGYILTSQTNSSNGDISSLHSADTSDFWLLRVDNVGNIVWEKTYGGTGSESIPNIIKTADGGFLLCGNTSSPVSGDVTERRPTIGNNNDCWLVKLDSTGLKQWVKTLGGSNAETTESAVQTTDGGYLLLGNTLSNDFDVSGQHGSFDIWLVKINASGILQWQKCIGGSSSDFGIDIFETQDGAIIVSGMSMSNDGDITGHHGSGTSYDVWVGNLMFGPNGLNDLSNYLTDLLLYPNPANSNCFISFDLLQSATINAQILDLSGHVITTLKHDQFNHGKYQLTWDIRDKDAIPVKNGLYVIRIQGENFSVTKMINVLN